MVNIHIKFGDPEQVMPSLLNGKNKILSHDLVN